MTGLKIIAIGDLHIKEKTCALLQPMYDELVDIVRKNIPDYVFFMGDQLDGHDKVSVICLKHLHSLKMGHPLLA